MMREERKVLEDFAGRISEVKCRALGKKGFDAGFSSGWGLGVRLATELFGGVVVGAGIGLLLDFWFGTEPLLLIIFLLFGSIAGVLNVYRALAVHGDEERKEDEGTKS